MCGSPSHMTTEAGVAAIEVMGRDWSAGMMMF